MPNRRELAIIIKASAKLAIRGIKALGRTLKSMGKTGVRVAKIMRTGFRALKKTLGAVAQAFKTAMKFLLLPLAALTLGFGLAVREAASFQQAMANVISVVGGTTTDMRRLTESALEMGRTTVFTAQEAASAMYDLGSAGFSTDQIIGALKGTMLLAAATASDLTFTAETMTTAIKQFGLEANEAGRVANAFAASISFSKLNMDRLSTAIAFAGPVAAALGHTLEGTLSVLAAFADMGLRASMVGTTFRQGLLQLQRAMPAKDIEKGADVLKRLGIQFKDIDPSVNSVADIVEKLTGKVNKMSEAVALFGVRAGGPFLQLIKAGPGPLREFEKKITDTRKAFEMTAIQINTFQGALRLLKSGIQSVQIRLGNAFLPVLTEIVRIITKWANVIGTINWTKWWKGLTSGSEEAVERLSELKDLFTSGGPFRKALMDWGIFFVTFIGKIAKVVWIPLQTELIIIFRKLGVIIRESIGKALSAIGNMKFFKLFPATALQALAVRKGGARLQAGAAETRAGLPGREEELRVESRERLVSAFGEFAEIGTQAGVARKSTTEFLDAFTKIIKKQSNEFRKELKQVENKVNEIKEDTKGETLGQDEVGGIFSF